MCCENCYKLMYLTLINLGKSKLNNVSRDQEVFRRKQSLAVFGWKRNETNNLNLSVKDI